MTGLDWLTAGVVGFATNLVVLVLGIGLGARVTKARSIARLRAYRDERIQKVQRMRRVVSLGFLDPVVQMEERCRADGASREIGELDSLLLHLEITGDWRPEAPRPAGIWVEDEPPPFT